MQISAEVTAVVIYDSRLYNRNGQVRRWAESVERNFTSNVRRFAPVRSGELVASTYGYVQRIGPRHLQTIIANDAPHVFYVLRGTGTPIESTRETDSRGRPPGKMRLKPGNGYGVLYRDWVSGQKANNFFLKAAWQTASRHSSLRGFSPDINV